MADKLQKNREEVERLKDQYGPIIEKGRKFWKKKVFDNHIIDLLEHFGYSTKDKIVIEIFGNLERSHEEGRS